MSEKSNIRHLRDILEGFNKTHGIDLTEAHEFLDAAEEEEAESADANLKIKRLEEKVSELEDELDSKEEEEPEYANEDFVGLDTIRWDLQNGNLIIMQQMEGFVARLKHQNAVTPS